MQNKIQICKLLWVYKFNRLKHRYKLNSYKQVKLSYILGADNIDIDAIAQSFGFQFALGGNSIFNLILKKNKVKELAQSPKTLDPIEFFYDKIF